MIIQCDGYFSINLTKFKKLKSEFSEHAESYGFSKSSSSNLLINDDTLLFANSTIAGFKEYLTTDSLPDDGFYIIQDCIRNHNLKVIRDKSDSLDYMSCFTQVGLLGGKKSFSRILDFSLSFLTHKLGVPYKNILFKTSSELIFFQNKLISYGGLNISIDCQSDEYYKWNYGLKNIYGRGITIAIYNKLTSSFEDVGNIIEICKDDCIIGYEFGFGIETLISRCDGLGSPFDSSIVSSFFIGLDPIWKNKFLDSLMLTTLLISLGCKIGRGKRNAILRHSINDLCYLVHVLELDLNYVIIVSKWYSLQMKLPDDMIEKIIRNHFGLINDKVILAEKYIHYTIKNRNDIESFYRYCQNKLGFIMEFIDEISILSTQIKNIRKGSV
ncbi:hypothetical protein [Photorhabdus viridis]|uniref:hypothetical protein n=1 Tax=Photorhabdus viridis TaxID=3163327 RepID=UPI003306E447